MRNKTGLIFKCYKKNKKIQLSSKTSVFRTCLIIVIWLSEQHNTVKPVLRGHLSDKEKVAL